MTHLKVLVVTERTLVKWIHLQVCFSGSPYEKCT